MAEWSKALRSGRSPLLWARVQIPLLTRKLLSLLDGNPMLDKTGMLMSHLHLTPIAGKV